MEKTTGKTTVYAQCTYRYQNKKMYSEHDISKRTGMSLQSIRNLAKKYRCGSLIPTEGFKYKRKLYTRADLSFIKSRKGKVGNPGKTDGGLNPSQIETLNKIWNGNPGKKGVAENALTRKAYLSALVKEAFLNEIKNHESDLTDMGIKK